MTNFSFDFTLMYSFLFGSTANSNKALFDWHQYYYVLFSNKVTFSSLLKIQLIIILLYIPTFFNIQEWNRETFASVSSIKVRESSFLLRNFPKTILRTSTAPASWPQTVVPLNLRSTCKSSLCPFVIMHHVMTGLELEGRCYVVLRWSGLRANRFRCSFIVMPMEDIGDSGSSWNVCGFYKL